MRITRGIRLVVFVIALLILAVGVFSAFALVQSREHICVGDRCIMCTCIAHLQALCKGLGACLALFVPVALLAAPAFAGGEFWPARFSQPTPVGYKTRSNS